MNPSPFAHAAGRFLAVVGSVCLLGPLVGFALPAWTMFRQFDVAAQTGMEVDSAANAHAVHVAFVVTIYGLGFGLLGVVLVCLACCVFRYASPWLRGFLLVGAVPLLAAFPIGTILALVLLRLRRDPQMSARPTAA